jgi:hypothetical protein
MSELDTEARELSRPIDEFIPFDFKTPSPPACEGGNLFLSSTCAPDALSGDSLMPVRALPIGFGTFLVMVQLNCASLVGSAHAAGPSRVTLPTGRAPLSKVLADLTRQTGIRVEDNRGEPDREVSLTLKEATFWQALDHIAAAAQARVYLYPRDGRITLVKRSPTMPQTPPSYDGAFRTMVKKVVASLDLETGSRTSTVSLEVAWEPHLLPLLLETRPQSMRLQDDRGRSIPVPEDGNALAPVDGRISLTFDVVLPPLPRSALRIGRLEGQLTAIVPSKMLTFSFDTLAHLDKAPGNGPPRVQSQEGVTCTISKITLAKDHWSVRIVLDYPPGGKTLESFQSWVVNNEMILVSAQGDRRAPSSSYVLENSSPRQAILTYHFLNKDRRPPGKPEDWKLTYRTPASIIETPLRFSLTDVPLP